MKNMILKARVTTAQGVAELNAKPEMPTLIYVTYYRNSGKEITEYAGEKTKKIIDELLKKAEAKTKKERWTLWSY
jgi:transcription initiation factor IIE alpha subunit